mmetsp:Transcript_25772/g.66360  ORF Transcript_25772/g.66360 Transcript_25772/m.66360 type:complete len:455 (+) Transcript_25772:147-1511(+)
MDATFHCQSCRARLTVSHLDGLAAAGSDEMGSSGSKPPGGGEAPAAMVTAADAGGSFHADRGSYPRIDESFIVLDEDSQAQAGGRRGVQPGAGGRSLGESYVLLQGQAQQAAGQQGGFHLDAHLNNLTRLFELASQEAEVDHPLCLECSEQLREELEMQVVEAYDEVERYEAALQRLDAEGLAPMTQAQFEEELRQLREAEAAERSRAEELEGALEAAEAEGRQLAGAAAELDALEERYFHDFNDFKAQLRAHVGERDALLSKIDRAASELERLRCTNVYNDAFHIWYNGPFGTISGFRLGRHGQEVEWNELNAAWGQATLLLHTMAQNCRLNFSQYRLLPMGSHPRVADKKSTYDLFGPPKLWSGNYDKGMMCYLACLEEFAMFARNHDHAAGKEPPFELHYPIEGDRVGGMTVKLTFNKDLKWTKALKYMLTDLKLCLRWMIEKQEAGELTA